MTDLDVHGLNRDDPPATETTAHLKELSRELDELSERGRIKLLRRSIEHVPTKSWLKVFSEGFGELAEEEREEIFERIAEHIPAEFLFGLAEKRPPRGKLDYPHADIYLRVTSKAERLRLRACAKEPATVEWIEQWVKAGDTFYDIGANVGAYSLVAARWSRGRAQVIAFEPGYANFAALCENIVSNDCAESIMPLSVGLSDRTALGIFEYRDLQPGAARQTLSDVRLAQGDTPVYRQRVPSYRLDDLVEQFELPWPNHVKLDVDGTELAVLEGATKMLQAPTFRSLMAEVDERWSAEIIQLLEGHGIPLRKKIERRTKDGRSNPYWYGLFAPEASGPHPGDGNT
jgi:FkbM family methyltransferase